LAKHRPFPAVRWPSRARGSRSRRIATSQCALLTPGSQHSIPWGILHAGLANESWQWHWRINGVSSCRCSRHNRLRQPHTSNKRAHHNWCLHSAHFAQDTWCCNSYTRVGTNLKFCGPKTGVPRRFDPATYLCEYPPEKKRPPRPGQGQRQRSARHRRWHRRVARGPPLFFPARAASLRNA
jgi:hypothetical protein